MPDINEIVRTVFGSCNHGARAHRRPSVWSRSAMSMPACSTSPITRRVPPTARSPMLLHGFPYDIHSYVDVAPMLAAQGCRVIVPYLRGYGPTRFLDAATPRSGEQAAIGADLMALMDALSIPRAVFAGYDWGGRAACVGAALWPERCIGLVSVNSYLIQDIAQRAEAGDGRSARCRCGISGISRSSAGVRGLRPTGAASRASCGSNGRRTGSSTRRASSGRRSPTTILTTSTSSSTPIAIATASSMAIRDTPTSSASSRPAADHRAGDHARRRRRRRRACDRRQSERRQIHREPRSPQDPARGPQPAAGGAGSVRSGGDGVDKDIGESGSHFRRGYNPR